MAYRSIPMGLIPTVCGAVKVLQVRKSLSGKSINKLQNTEQLKREGLELARDAMRRALSKRVLEMTPSGNCRLKVVADSFTVETLADRMFCENRNKKNRGSGKSKTNAVPKRIMKPSGDRLRKMVKKKKSKIIRMARGVSHRSGKSLAKIVRDKTKKDVKNKSKRLKHRKPIKNTLLDVGNQNSILEALTKESLTLKNIKERGALKTANVELNGKPMALTLPLKKRLRKKLIKPSRLGFPFQQ